MCRDSPKISHLLFDDDSLILMMADSANVVSLKRILDDYCAASGHLVSVAKLSIFVSPNTHVEVKAEVLGNVVISKKSYAHARSW